MKRVLMVIGGCSVLCIFFVGGCVGLGMWGLISAMDIPDYATKNHIETAHGADIDKIQTQLSENKSLTYTALSFELSDAVIGILKEDPQKSFNAADVYKKYSDLNRTSHASVNGAGVAEVNAGNRTIQCVSYDLNFGSDEYVILIKDYKYDPGADD